MMHIVSPLLFVWSGLLIGVSFVATPARFLAPSLQLPQALDVGRWTFHVLTLVARGPEAGADPRGGDRQRTVDAACNRICGVRCGMTGGADCNGA
jgi:hypothetical protein